jgi:hypothetical protein
MPPTLIEVLSSASTVCYNSPLLGQLSTSLGPLPRWVLGPTTRWVLGPTTRWAPGTTRLVPHSTCWREAQGLRWRSTRIGSYAYHTM